MRVTDQVTTQRTSGVDAATLRQWAKWVAHLAAECPGSLLRVGLHLHGEIAAAADALEAEEVEYAAWVDEVGRSMDVCPQCGSDTPHGNCEACADKMLCPLCGEPLNGETAVHADCADHEAFLADCAEMYLQSSDGGTARVRVAS